MRIRKYKVFALFALALLVTSLLLTTARASLYWKEKYPDYAPSGMPDFDQRQDLWWPFWYPAFNWSWCAPTAVANSLWWMDSRYETSTTPPPTANNTFNLVTSYATMPPFWDDHDPNNVMPFIQHLAYLMDTDGQRTWIQHPTTYVIDMETGIAQYLSWTGVNPQGDVNGDGIVDQTDWNIVNASLGSYVVVPDGSAMTVGPWNMAADIYPVTTGWPNRIPADNIVNASDLALVTANMNSTGMFYERTIPNPDFYVDIEEEVMRSEDVVLTLGFYIEINATYYYRVDEQYPYGHSVTVAGINSTTMQIAISDPAADAFEQGLAPGRSPVPHPHMPPEPPYITHNNASLVSHDIYNVTFNPVMGMWELLGYAGYPTPPWHVLIENAVITSPLIHDVAVINVSSLYPQVDQGQVDPINVTVENQGDLPETVDVYAFYDGNLAAPKQTIPLNPGQNITLTFDWNTTGVPLAIYTISANATIPIDDDPLDNYLSDGTQEVIPEFPPAIILPLFTILSLITVVLKSKKKKQ